MKIYQTFRVWSLVYKNSCDQWDCSAGSWRRWPARNVFAQYLPQFFYAVLAPLTLSCLPLISPVVGIVCLYLCRAHSNDHRSYPEVCKAFVQVLGPVYAAWRYVLENLRGLTTAKIYKADGFNQADERRKWHLRRITMKVLTMQLNSITVMDVVAFVGAWLFCNSAGKWPVPLYVGRHLCHFVR